MFLNSFGGLDLLASDPLAQVTHPGLINGGSPLRLFLEHKSNDHVRLRTVCTKSSGSIDFNQNAHFSSVYA